MLIYKYYDIKFVICVAKNKADVNQFLQDAKLIKTLDSLEI